MQVLKGHWIRCQSLKVKIWVLYQLQVAPDRIPFPLWHLISWSAKMGFGWLRHVILLMVIP